MGVNTCPRLCSLLATLAQETTEFIYMDEIGGGAAYEANFDIGNLYKGDGDKFHGRGAI